MKKTDKKDNTYLFCLVIFSIMLGFGAAFMQYNMLNPIVNLGLTIVGLIGAITLSILVAKKIAQK